ncbi:hypothetical protein EVAR_77131_1 [Eumeta japonica]|uniref:Uncharacterized protein n=1 Tax=Eumeta variegata TaxID=151549 RepID=A0A4C1T4Q0_EUMVA|nr:hypothetical protein EVAR_77131_1 [Eumeta japonica]
MCSGQVALSMEKNIDRTLTRLQSWRIGNKLRLAPSNTNSTVLTKKLKYDDLVVHMNGEQISLVGEIRLLGREDHIRRSDRAHSTVRVVRLSTYDWEARRVKDARRYTAQHLGDTFVDRELEKPVYFGELPHPAYVPESGYECRGPGIPGLAVAELHIYSDGSLIEGKVDATLTEWRDGKETWYTTLRLDVFCIVFQAEMVVLQRVIRRVRNGKGGLVDIFSDFRSFLEVLIGPKIYHLLADEARREISEIVSEGRAVRLFCIEHMLGLRERSVQTSSPGRPPSLERWQRISTGFCYRM